MDYAVSIMWLNGVRTVNVFKDIMQATRYANVMANKYKGCRVFIGTEVIAQSETDTDTEE